MDEDTRPARRKPGRPRLYTNEEIKERRRASRKRYRDDNPDKVKDQIQRWVDANPDLVREQNRRRSAKESAEVKLARSRRRIDANREAIYEANRQWRADHRVQLNIAKSQWRAANPDWVQDRVRQRRALLRECFVEKYRRRDIFERDGWICQLCMEPVDPTLKGPNMRCRSIDHIIPLCYFKTHGGGDCPANVQLAHLICNIWKNDTLPPGIEPL